MNDQVDNNDAKTILRANGHLRDFDDRLRKVELGISEINKTLEHMATSTNVSDLKSELLKWMIGTVITVSVVGVGILNVLK